jgi:antirestriction protein ArdC
MNAQATLTQSFERLASLTDQALRSDEMRNWLKCISRFWKYSFGNTVLIAVQRPDATLVAGMKTWNQMGRKVKKGEHGIAILVPVLVSKQKPESGEQEIMSETSEELEKVLRFRTGYVFDISQTEGDTLPQLQWWSDGDAPAELLERIKTAMVRDGIIVREVEVTVAGKKARGVSMGGVVEVISNSTLLAKASTHIHEWAHEIRRRNPDDSQPREVEEVIVEAVAFVVLSRFGLNPENNANYIALWQGGKDHLRKNMETIKSLSTEILEKIEAVEEKEAENG